MKRAASSSACSSHELSSKLERVWENLTVSHRPDSKAEILRLQALADTKILDSDPEENFNDLAVIAAEICGVPISLVSFVAADRQWFKAEVGLGAKETSRDVSFCAHTLNTHQVLVVPDALEDPRFRDNALVTGEPGIRFYAGAPIVTHEGHALGTVCVIDRVPRTLPPAKIEALKALARQASSLLERRMSLKKTERLTEEAQTATAFAKRTGDQLQLAMESAGLAAWSFDPARGVVSGDDRMAELFGLDVPEGPAEVWLEAIVPEDRERVGKEFAASLAGAPYDTKYRVGAQGKVRWLHARATMSRDSESRVALVGICEDVTREETLSRELANSVERLQIAQSASGASTFDWDLQTGHVKWTHPCFGRPPNELAIASDVFPLIHPADRPPLEAAIHHALSTGEEYFFECRAFWPDGSIHWVRTAGKPLLNADGKAHSVVGVNVDVTDRKLAEEALLHSEKLAAVGRLASTISHEINNPLEAVTNLLYIARQSPSISQTDRDHLELADRELARVSTIVSQTLRFHRNPTAPTIVRASGLIDDVLSLYGTRLAASEITIDLKIEGNVAFTAYEGDIRQILNNLVANAFDVMRNGGTLKVRARCATDWSDMRRGAVITIADSGPGMPAEVRTRVFEAFFSTKGIHGSGLGLWISKRIAHKHRGHLDFRTFTGEPHGTTFRLWLPLEAAPTAGDPWA